MVSKKEKKEEAKQQKLTKLKKRKLEKHKRKQMEKKFLYRNKSVILGISAIIVLILGSFGAYSIYEYTQEGKSIVNLGDEVNFNFICYYDNGYVIDHTLVSTPNDVTVDTDLGGDQLKNSQSLLIGGYQTVSGVLIPLYWNDEMFLEEKKGETFYISIPAEDVYGPDYSPITEAERLFNVSRETEMDRYGSMDLDEFEEDYGTPEVDMELEIDDYNVKIISVGDDTVEYEFMYEEGDSIMYEYGSGQITDKTDDKFVIFYDGTTDEVFYALVGSVYLPVHIKEVTDDELAIEVDHYNYKVLIDNIDKDVIDQDDWSISDGDFVIVRYIGYYEGGEVFASSITDDIELTSDLPLDDTYEHEPLYLTVTPGTTIDGTSTVIEGFNDALKGMVAGEEKTIEVPPEEGYGEYDESLVEEINYLVGVYDLIEVVPKSVTMTLEDYIEQYESEPYVGDTITYSYGTGMITDVEDGVTIELELVEEDEFYYHNVTAMVIDEDDETITIEHYPIDGGFVYTDVLELAYVSVQDDTFTIEYDPEEFEVGGSFSSGTITEVGEGSFTVDYNHSMAGKTLYFRIKVMDFRKVSD